MYSRVLSILGRAVFWGVGSIMVVQYYEVTVKVRVYVKSGGPL